MNRFTPVKLLPLILSTLLLTSCSGPDSSGGIEFSKTANSFPYGDCRGSGYQTHSTAETGCGYFVSQNANPENSYYIMSNGNLSGANLSHASLTPANLTYANLTNADLTFADLSYCDLTGATRTDVGVKANSSTICPNGVTYGYRYPNGASGGDSCHFLDSRFADRDP